MRDNLAKRLMEILRDSLRDGVQMVRGGLTNLRGIVDELTDQNAYARYLATHGLAHSPDAWRAFQDEHWQAKSRRGRCC